MARGIHIASRLNDTAGSAWVLGTFVKLPCLESVELAHLAGFDFVVVDLEHAQLDADAACRLVRHARGADIAALVRVPSIDGGLVNRLLEAGATGIQLSTVTTEADANGLRRVCLYPPDGARSISLASPAAGYGSVPIDRYLDQQRAHPPLVVGQIETATTSDPLGEVIAGLDVAFLGTTDLSLDMGRPGQLDDPRVQARMADVADAAMAAGVPLGGWAADATSAARLHELGARYIVVGSDVQLLGRALADTRTAVTTQLQERQREVLS